MNLISSSLDGEVQVCHDKTLEVLSGVMMGNKPHYVDLGTFSVIELYWYVPDRRMLKVEILSHSYMGKPSGPRLQPPVLISGYCWSTL